MSYFTDPNWSNFNMVRPTTNLLFANNHNFWDRFLPSFARDEFRTIRKQHNNKIKIKKYLNTPRHITFPCSHYNIHTISIWPTLKIKWHNHDLKDIKNKVMAFLLLKAKDKEKSMTQYLCGCEQIYLKLTHPELVGRYDINTLDGNSQSWLEQISNITKHRKAFNDEIKKESFKSLRELIKEELSRNLIPKLNNELNYRAPGNKYGKVDYNFIITTDRTPSMEVEVRTEQIKRGWRRTTTSYQWILNCFLPPTWYMSIYKKNLWNFNGNLVLDIKKRYPYDMALALLGKQSHGAIIKTNWAILNYEFKTIRWIEEEEAKEFLETERLPRRMSPRVKEEKPPNEENQIPTISI